MQLYNSFIYNKFINSLIKKGKKSKIQKLFNKFYYNTNLIILYGYWYAVSSDASSSVLNKNKLFKKDFLVSVVKSSIPRNFSIRNSSLVHKKKKNIFFLLKQHQQISFLTKSFKSYVMNKYKIFFLGDSKFFLKPNFVLYRNLFYNFFFFKKVCNRREAVFYDFIEKLCNRTKLTYAVQRSKMKRLKFNIIKNKNFFNSYKFLNNLSYFYSRFSFMQLNFFVSQFLVFQIVYSLLPLLGLRMTSVQKEGKSLKKKGRRRKPYGIPIVLSQYSQLTYALNFFKKSLFYSVSKNKAVKNFSFKDVLNEELVSFLFFKNSTSLRFKKDLYRRIIDFRSNFHFR